MLSKKTKKTNILATGAIIALLPVMSYALQGTYVTEPFSCKVALEDYAELQRVLEITPRTDFKYQLFLDEYETVVKALAEHTECKGD
jgi:hypothetical protein